MPYIGNIPAEKYAAFNVQYFTTSATDTYTLDRAVANELDIRLVINNVIQEPGSGKAYTAAGTTLTLSAATAGSDTMYAVYIGKAVQTVNPGAGSVGTTALADNAVTNAKLADATQGDVIYYGAAGAPAQLSAGTNGHFLKTQGAGANPTWAAVPDSGITAANFRPNATPLMVNGSMAVTQRATSATGKTTTDIYTCDRMSAVIDSIGTYTVAQEAQTSGNAFANGFANAWRIDCTTADASPAASDQLEMQYTFEGQDLQVFKKGTANAEKYTLAFWVKSNKTGTGNIQLKDKDNSNRQCTQSYTISSANTWEHKVCVFGADTTGAMDDDNAKSLIINWWLGSGTDYSSGTANHGVWEAQDNTKVNSGGTLNINDNTANDWSITGIQLEVGEYTSANIPPFQFESYGDNLARCQRYYYFHCSEADNGGSDTTICLTAQYNSSSMKGFIPFPTQMRTKPTLKQNTGSNMYRLYETNSNATMTSIAITSEGRTNFGVVNAGSSISVTQGSAGNLQTMDSTAFVAFDAEL